MSHGVVLVTTSNRHAQDLYLNTELLERGDQQFVVSTFAGVAADLCSVFLQSDNAASALRYLEKGRAVIIGQLIDARIDSSLLERHHPDVARRYQRLRNEANMPVRHVEESAVRRQVQAGRVEALAQLRKCIQETRKIFGHERFMLGQEISEMQQCAAGGLIIVVNITKVRSDAIIVSATSTRALHLPRLCAEDALTWLRKKWSSQNEEYLQYLAWLWDACVEPIIEGHRLKQEANSLPRVWWIGVGLAGSMPFHAAGMHGADSTTNALCRVISSYSPSIKALAHAQQQAKITGSAQGQLLITTMPTTPGEKELIGVIEEKNQLIGAVDNRLPIKHLDLPNVQEVVDNLSNCSIAHFACHGYTDYSDPSQSGLILQNGAEQDRLTVQKVSDLELRNTRLAYLSACSTAENKAAHLADEVIHVASGFLVAGFPHVIGCLWSSKDWVCVEAANQFYLSLLRDQIFSWSDQSVASALREAVVEVRKAVVKKPLLWAQIVHIGV